MRIAITGGSGFVGSHVVDKLKGAAITDIRVLDIKQPHRNDVEFVKTDITKLEEVKNALKDIDVVYHLAGAADVNDVYKDPLWATKLNVDGTANVLEVARQLNIQRVIFASTVWIYSGSPGTMANEESQVYSSGAGHVYNTTKIAGEMMINDYNKLYGVPFTIMRYGIPYGPRARPTAVIPIFVRKALNKEPLTIQGDGSQFRFFLYVEDLAEGNVAALKKIAKNQVYNMDGQKPTTVRQMAETIRNIIGNVNIVYTPARPGDYQGKYVSIDKARRELDWEPRTPFEVGLSRYVDWHRENYQMIEAIVKSQQTNAQKQNVEVKKEISKRPVVKKRKGFFRLIR